MKAARTIVPILIYVVLIPAVLFSFSSDRAIRIAFIGLVFAVSSMAGHELAAVVPWKAALIGGVFVWAGVAVACARGFGMESTKLSEYLGYFTILVMGVIIPLTLVIEGIRRQRRGE